MAKIVWLADVEGNPEVVARDGEDPKPVQVYKDATFEASENDPYIRRAIARGYAKIVADPEKAAHTTPEAQEEPPETEDDKTDNQEEDA